MGTRGDCHDLYVRRGSHSTSSGLYLGLALGGQRFHCIHALWPRPRHFWSHLPKCHHATWESNQVLGNHRLPLWLCNHQHFGTDLELFWSPSCLPLLVHCGLLAFGARHLLEARPSRQDGTEDGQLRGLLVPSTAVDAQHGALLCSTIFEPFCYGELASSLLHVPSTQGASVQSEEWWAFDEVGPVLCNHLHLHFLGWLHQSPDSDLPKNAKFEEEIGLSWVSHGYDRGGALPRVLGHCHHHSHCHLHDLLGQWNNLWAHSKSRG